MVYLTDLSKNEANYILIAFHRLKGYLDYDTTLCSHSHEKEFLSRHNSLLHDCRNEFYLVGVVKMIHENIADIAANEIFLKRIILKFQNMVKRMSFSETLLWCSSLLVDFHKREECSEYMSLALKFKFFSYWWYGESESSNTVIETMTELLDYITAYNCKHELFVSCLGIFLRFYPLNKNDQLVPILPEVMYAAHKLRLNMFNIWKSGFRLDFKKYAQISLLQHLSRFLILTKYGYEDIRFDQDTDTYMICLCAYDRYNLFGTRTRCNEVKALSHKRHRSVQVLFLYIQTTYEDVNPSQEIFDQSLHTLWETITDPYLTRRHFMFFKQIYQFPEYLKVWKWYSKIVLKGEMPESSPRSLKHLSRCSVRRALCKCAQLPFGVEHLDIPQILKSYLCLE